MLATGGLLAQHAARRLSGLLSGIEGTLSLLPLGRKGHGTHLAQPLFTDKHGNVSKKAALAALPRAASLQAASVHISRGLLSYRQVSTLGSGGTDVHLFLPAFSILSSMLQAAPPRP